MAEVENGMIPGPLILFRSEVRTDDLEQGSNRAAMTHAVKAASTFSSEKLDSAKKA